MPKVSFKFDPDFAIGCEVTVQSKWSREAKARVPFFRDLWMKDASVLLDFVYVNFKGRFPEGRYTARLSACPSTVSYSRPLVLNVSRFLKSYVGVGAVNPDHAFVVLTFHELMHNWVEHNLHSSKLLKKYKNESSTVQVHLHLMALEQFTYLSLGRRDLLEWIERKYPSIGGYYARAWKIVNQEGHGAFLDEL